MNNKEAFTCWFRQATGNEPYPFQIRFACEPTLPELVDVPTGMGKTSRAEHMIGLFGLAYWKRWDRAAIKHALSYDWLIGRRLDREIG